MNTKLYIGGLPYSTTDQDLQSEFSVAGTVVSATVIRDRMTGRSKGFGFVEFGSEDEANKAIDMFNGKDFGGRTITVNVARPMEPREPRAPRSDYGRGGYR